MGNKILDLIEQTSTTTGTSAYTMAAATTGRRAFTDVASGSVVPYASVDDAGGYELGFGTWNGTTLARTIVLASSNSNAAVSWAAGTRRVYVTAHAAALAFAAVRHNLGAGSTPTTTDDSGDGYGINSLWGMSDGRVFVCTDATSSAAVWQQMLLPGEQGLFGLNVFCPAVIDFTKTQWFKPGGGRGLLLGDGRNAGSSYEGFAERAYSFHGVAGATTTDATATSLQSMLPDGSGIGMGLSGDGIYIVKGLVTASKNSASGDRKAWEVTCAAKRVSGTVTIGTVTKTELLATAGASAWAIDVIEDLGTLYFQATGQAATEIAWSADFTFTANPVA